MSEQELKERFFAQYYGARFTSANRRGMTTDGDMDNGWHILNVTATLILKNIESINPEDVLNVSTCSEKLSIANHKNVILKRLEMDTLTINQVDLLRSKGYLIPFMNLSIEEIISKGWAKYE